MSAPDVAYVLLALTFVLILTIVGMWYHYNHVITDANDHILHLDHTLITAFEVLDDSAYTVARLREELASVVSAAWGAIDSDVLLSAEFALSDMPEDLTYPADLRAAHAALISSYIKYTGEE